MHCHIRQFCMWPQPFLTYRTVVQGDGPWPLRDVASRCTVEAGREVVHCVVLVCALGTLTTGLVSRWKLLMARLAEN